MSAPIQRPADAAASLKRRRETRAPPLANGQSVRVSEGVLRVVQLNVDSLVRSGWLKRRHEIVTWLDELNADVACFQEVWQDDRHPNTAGWIAEHAAGNWHWEFGGFPPSGPGRSRCRPVASVRFCDPEPMALQRGRGHELARRW